MLRGLGCVVDVADRNAVAIRSKTVDLVKGQRRAGRDYR
jgi:hypothetical protein